MKQPEKFWAEIAEQQVEWFKKWDKVMDYNFDIKKGPISVKFFEGGKLNVSYNCLDKHLKTRGNKVAIQWEGNEPGEEKAFTYKMLHEEVCKFANVLKANGIKKGDRVCSLYADGSRTGNCHAGLFPHRRHSWNRFRRIQR